MLEFLNVGIQLVQIQQTFCQGKGFAKEKINKPQYFPHTKYIPRSLYCYLEKGGEG